MLGALALVVGWLALSLVLFLISSHFERTLAAGERRGRAATRPAIR